jgi:hypothetical protein
MVHAIWTTNFFGVIEGRGTVTIRQDVYVRSWEDLQGCFERRSDDIRGLVTWNQECSVSDVLCYRLLGREVSRRRIFLEENE